MMELVDVTDSKSVGGDIVSVRVRLPAPARRKRHIACDELFHFIAKLIARSFCCSSLPNRTRCAGLRFGFGCKPECCGIYTVAIFHVVAKFPLRPRLFMPMAKKTSSARSQHCSSFPNGFGHGKMKENVVKCASQVRGGI